MKRLTTLREADIVSGGVLAAFGVFVTFQSLQLSFYSDRVPGPGFFPALLGIALIIAGGYLLLTRLRSTGDSADGFTLPNRQQAIRALSLWVTILVATLLVGPLGFLLPMFLLVGVILFVIESRRGLGPAVTTIAIPLLTWLLFVQLLQVRLPAGPFGF